MSYNASGIPVEAQGVGISVFPVSSTRELLRPLSELLNPFKEGSSESLDILVAILDPNDTTV